MRNQFKDTLLKLAEDEPRFALLFGDISVFLFREFQAKYPNRFYNLGICEATLISVAAGLSSQGFIPIVHSIAPFVTERAMEQIKLDLVYNELPAKIVSCGATFDYAWDGTTHHAWTDTGWMRMLPNFEICQPGSKKETDQLLCHYLFSSSSSYIRLSDNPHGEDINDITPGKGIILQDQAADLTVVTAGPILKNVKAALDGISANLIYYNVLKPFDSEPLQKFKNTKIKVVHDAFGLFEAVCENLDAPVKKLGLPDRFCCSYGTIDDVRKLAGLDVESIRAFFLKE